MANFIEAIEGDIVAVAEAAWNQTKVELATLEAALLGEIKADIAKVLNTVEGGTTMEELETMLLNMWEQEKPQIISALSSGAIQILIAVAKTAISVAI